MKRYLRNNGLSITFLILFFISFVGQIFTGLAQHNLEMAEEGGQQVNLLQYLSSGHFLQATFENWESEFLQMGVFVVLAVFLFQKGSSESKDPDGKKKEVDNEPNPNKKEAPWPVKQGGLILQLYKNSLSIALFLLFALSFLAHWHGSMKEYNQLQVLKNKPTASAFAYITESRFWFESFQNWQSEFLSIFAIIVLSVYLRQKGSPQSKPVDAPLAETGA